MGAWVCKTDLAPVSSWVAQVKAKTAGMRPIVLKAWFVWALVSLAIAIMSATQIIPIALLKDKLVRPSRVLTMGFASLLAAPAAVAPAVEITITVADLVPVGTITAAVLVLAAAAAGLPAALPDVLAIQLILVTSRVMGAHFVSAM